MISLVDGGDGDAFSHTSTVAAVEGFNSFWLSRWLAVDFGSGLHEGPSQSHENFSCHTSRLEVSSGP
jgi:hypothetical protein